MDAENEEIIIIDEEEGLGDQEEDASIKSNTENEAVVDETKKKTRIRLKAALNHLRKTSRRKQ